MNQDIVANALNQMMNAKRARKNYIIMKHSSKLLLSVLALAKLKGYVLDYKQEAEGLKITIRKLHGCQAIKPRFMIKCDDIEKYVQRYLPAKEIGTLIISTSKGIMTHQTAQDKKIGGSLIAYMY